MPDIRHSIQISAAPDRIYQLGATAGGLGEWWATDITEPSANLVELGFFNRSTVYRLRSAVAQPPSHIEWICESGDEWSATHIVFLIEAAKPGMLLRFTHAGWRAESAYFTSCNTTWGELMFRLKAAAEGKVPGPLVHSGRMGGLMAHYRIGQSVAPDMERSRRTCNEPAPSSRDRAPRRRTWCGPSRRRKAPGPLARTALVCR